MTDRERADAAEATLDFVVALHGDATNTPPPPPGSVFLIRTADDGGYLVATLVDYRGVEVAEFGHGGALAQMNELAARLGFPPERIRISLP